MLAALRNVPSAPPAQITHMRRFHAASLLRAGGEL